MFVDERSDDERFKDSPEYDDWVESGGRDEDYSDSYNEWHRRERNDD